MNGDTDGPKNEGESPWVAVARYMGLGLEVAVTVILSIYVGHWLDERFGHTPLFLVISLIIGFAVAINILIIYSKSARRDMNGNGGE